MLYGQSTFFRLRFVIFENFRNDGNGGPRQCALYTHNKKRTKSQGWPQRVILGFLSALLCCLTAWLGGLSNISRGQCALGILPPIPAFSILISPPQMCSLCQSPCRRFNATLLHRHLSTGSGSICHWDTLPKGKKPCFLTVDLLIFAHLPRPDDEFSIKRRLREGVFPFVHLMHCPTIF